MTYFFYDVETSGISPKTARIMQFAGQRADADLQPVGEPVNVLIKLTPDILPEPEAVLINGITPQMSLTDGLSEAEFLKLFYQQVVAADTIYLGYNSIHFDDEFMRYLHYRNFYDAYDWQQSADCSRWDLLDVIRMTRALRPEGIEWPLDNTGQPTNRLEQLTAANHLEHSNAHNALSDVNATIALAQLLHRQQPKLFDFLKSVRTKKEVIKLVLNDQPLVYTSNAFPGEHLKTSVVVTLSQLPKNLGSIVYDLRYDPSQFLKLTPEELAQHWSKYYPKDQAQPWPITSFRYNQCPAVAPLGVLDETCQKRLQLDLAELKHHHQMLKRAKEFTNNLAKAYELLERQWQSDQATETSSVDGQLYEGFFDAHDHNLLSVIRSAAPDELSGFVKQLHDRRLRKILPLYQARNYPSSLSTTERSVWDNYCQQQLLSGQEESRLARYLKQIQDLAAGNPTKEQAYLLEEMRLYGESLMPAEPLG